ncbi:FGGY family carbohydrate kinase [Propioniciclava soli]|uniref:ATP:glycerol 3-phosphotransferase n=1 Tax=Propioniciclava soli TaxID=2775081 RepID=A0ABZ3CB49_9ACTN
MNIHAEVIVRVPSVLALDQGTTSSKALVVTPSGRVLGTGSCPVGIGSPRPGWVEQDATELAHSVEVAARRALDEAGTVDILGVAISNQRESVVAWDARTRDVVGPMISWQDQRGDAACRALATPTTEALVRERSGLELGSMFSASKIAWFAQHADAGADLRVGTVDTWLLDRLTGGATYATEAGNASRTLLLNVAGLNWDADLCGLFGVDPAILPAVRPSTGPWGTTRNFAGLPDATPILAVLGDSHAALFGHWALEPGAAVGKATYGTGSSIMLPVDDPGARLDGIATTLAWQAPAPLWALEGNILYAGAGMDWLARTLGVRPGADFSALAAEASGSRSAVFVPALNGLGAPWWEAGAVGTLTGLDAASTRAEIARAGLESVAHQVCDVVEAMDPDATQRQLHAGGGATASAALMQIQADLLGRSLLVSSHADISAIGAAALAFDAAGSRLVPDATLAPRVVHPSDAFSADDRRATRGRWRDALTRAGVPAHPEPLATTTQER